jgi:SulP family sulfate permease
MFVNADENKKPSCPQILQLRSDNSIYFANAEYTIEQVLKRLEEHDTPIKYLLLDLHSMAFIDITGVDELRSLHDEVKIQGIQLSLMNVHHPVMEVLQSSGFINELTTDYLFQERGGAVSDLFKKIDHQYCKRECPYELFHECSTVK